MMTDQCDSEFVKRLRDELIMMERAVPPRVSRLLVEFRHRAIAARIPLNRPAADNPSGAK